MAYIEELGRELTGRMLEIWEGKKADGSPLDMPHNKAEAYRQLWRQQARMGTAPNGEAGRALRGVTPPTRPPTPPKSGGCGCKGKK